MGYSPSAIIFYSSQCQNGEKLQRKQKIKSFGDVFAFLLPNLYSELSLIHLDKMSTLKSLVTLLRSSLKVQFPLI